jgi:hypothetical protein
VEGEQHGRARPTHPAGGRPHRPRHRQRTVTLSALMPTSRQRPRRIGEPGCAREGPMAAPMPRPSPHCSARTSRCGQRTLGGGPSPAYRVTGRPPRESPIGGQPGGKWSTHRVVRQHRQRFCTPPPSGPSSPMGTCGPVRAPPGSVLQHDPLSPSWGKGSRQSQPGVAGSVPLPCPNF